MAHKLVFAGVDLDRKDGPFRKSDPYLSLRRLDDDTQIQTTDVVKQNLNPVWKSLDFDPKRFGNDSDPVVLVECWDWDSIGSHDLIGTFRAKSSELTNAGSEFQLTSKKGKNSGKIQVKSSSKMAVVAEKKEEQPIKKEEPVKEETATKNLLPDNNEALKYLTDQIAIEMEQARITPKEMTKEEREAFDDNLLAEMFADFQAGKGSAKDGRDTMILAIQRGRPDIVKVLADGGVDPTFNSNEPIRLSSFAKNGVETMKVLLSYPGVDPTTFDIPLSNPCFDGNEEMVKLLLADSRINPSSGDNRALRNAIKANHQNIVKLLLAHPKLILTAANRKEFHL